MVGLRTQENSKFLVFFKFVQRAASNMGKVFFMDCGEGHLFESEAMKCEDLSGWLIDKDRADEFAEIFESKKEIPDEWSEFGTFLSWKFENGEFEIKFE